MVVPDPQAPEIVTMYHFKVPCLGVICYAVVNSNEGSSNLWRLGARDRGLTQAGKGFPGARVT